MNTVPFDPRMRFLLDMQADAMVRRCARFGRRPRVYVAGPYTAPTSEAIAANVAAAVAVGVELRRLGMVPLVPHITIPGSGVSWKQAMIECLSHLRTCDFAVLMHGWERSRGARMEAWLCSRVRSLYPPLTSMEALEAAAVEAGIAGERTA